MWLPTAAMYVYLHPENMPALVSCRSQNRPLAARDRGREDSRLPALRTVRAVFPHTALQSVVSSSGLACQHMGLVQGEKPMGSEEGNGPA